MLKAVQVNQSPSWRYIIKLMRQSTTQHSAYPSVLLLITGAEHHKGTKGWDWLGYCSVVCLKNLVPFIVLMDSLNNCKKSIHLFLSQIYRYLFIEISYLRLAVANFQVICNRQRFNSLCRLSNKRHREILLPGSSFPQSSATKEVLHHSHPDFTAHPSIPKRQLLICQAESKGNMVHGVAAWHWIVRDAKEPCLHRYRSNKTDTKCPTSPPPRQRHKDVAFTYLLSALISPWRTSHITLLLQWEGVTNVGKSSVLFTLDLTRKPRRLPSISSSYNTQWTNKWPKN